MDLERISAAFKSLEMPVLPLNRQETEFLEMVSIQFQNIQWLSERQIKELYTLSAVKGA